MTHTLKFILALLLLVGCQNEELISPDDNRPNPNGSVGFRLQIEGSSIGNNGSNTKGTPHETLEKYDSVRVNVFSHTSQYEATEDRDVAFFRDIKLEKESTNWKCIPPLFWPLGQKLSFFAYSSDIPFADAGISFKPSTGEPPFVESILYKVPSDVNKQPDLLVSAKLDQPVMNNVSLTMKHALSCVSFVGTAPKKGAYVKSVTLRNVYSEGTLPLNDDTIVWTPTGSKGTTVFVAGIDTLKELEKDPLKNNGYLMTDSGYLMMIPQKLENPAIDVLYWNGKDQNDNMELTYILPVDSTSYDTWKPGMKYVYKFGIQSEEDITVVYYEKYVDNSYGLYYYDNDGTLQDSLDKDKDNAKVIIEAGYGALTQKEVEGSTTPPVRLGSTSSAPVVSGGVVKLTVASIESFLYPVDQSGESYKTFALSASTTPQDVYFNNSTRPCGKIVPHFAKGVYTDKDAKKTHAIRTPQQMRNITRSDASSGRKTHTYTQELNLDFSKASIGGGDLTTPVVNREFKDVFDGQNKKIENVSITATTTNGGLFVINSGEIKEVLLLNSSIISSSNTGGIAAENKADGVITKPQVMSDNVGKSFTIQGTKYVGAIVGLNYGIITGNTDIEVATELPKAEVSGWGLIKGKDTGTGGVAGQNNGTIEACLVNGVHVTGSSKGDVEASQITIEGQFYVGGIVGVNTKTINGNYSTVNGKEQAEPDVAGLVSITGTNFVGGIAGQNGGAEAVLKQVNLRLGRGDATKKIYIKGMASVGGIVGYNTNGGVLKAGTNSFISVRGNVHIEGTSNVGGIVGNNSSGVISNCFVYNFYSQLGTLVHYAPKITGETNVGGIVGYINAGTIYQCAVFSTVSGENGKGENTENAMAEIKATAPEKSSVGGIVGQSFTGGVKIYNSYVLGNVKINGPNFSGGIVGQNRSGTSITSVHIGNSGPDVNNIYTKLFDVVNLPVRDERMKTQKGPMTNTSGTPTIEGTIYVGGICGANWGEIENISIKDNVKIGTSTTNFVGGIAGGNGPDAKITNCKTYNPAPPSSSDPSSKVEIKGAVQVGGIVGLNNGIVKDCQLGLEGKGNSSLITIQGKEALGGIVGTNGGHENYKFDESLPNGTGNDNTSITNCNVYGKVLIEAVFGDAWDWYRIGGIIGENGLTNKVVGCNVIGYESSGTTTTGYDVTLKGSGTIGGIAGANYGHIYGSLDGSSYSKVTNTAVIATNMYAGGLVGVIKSDKKYTKFTGATLYYCDVSQGVLTHYLTTHSGAFVGQLDGEGGTLSSPISFGTTLGGITNKIYTGTTNPVIINGYSTSVILPPATLPEFYPEEPMVPDENTGNLWTRYQPFNYLHYTDYK